MTVRIVSALAATLVLAGCASSVSRGPRADLAITNVAVVDVRTGTLRPGQTVLVQGDTIVAAGPATQTSARGARVRIDGRSRYLAPGLWDAHTHLAFSGSCALQTLVANGVTSVRDMGSDRASIEGFRTASAAGRLVAPTIKAAGPVVENAGFVTRVTRILAQDKALAAFQMLELAPRVGIGAPEEAEAVVAAIADSGADLIKFRNIGEASFLAIARAARGRGLPLAGHAPLKTDPAEAAEAGLASFEHGESLSLLLRDKTPDARSASLRRIAAAGAMITPTLISDYVRMRSADVHKAAIDNPRAWPDVPPRLHRSWDFYYRTGNLKDDTDWATFFERSADDLKAAHRAGVPMLVGTDLAVTFIVPGSSVHEEMELMAQRLDMTPGAVLASATLNPARFFREDSKVGSIAPGLRADMILLNADPLADVRAVRNISAVFLRGRHFDRAALDRLTAETRQANREGRECVTAAP